MAIYSFSVSGQVISLYQYSHIMGVSQQRKKHGMILINIMIGLIQGQNAPSQIQKSATGEDSNYTETPYRWVIVGLMGCSLILSGLANNAIIPLQHKMTLIYGVSDTTVSFSVTLCFLAFSIANFPANYIIDTQGLRISFLIGTALYSLGTLSYSLINLSYNWMLIGTILLGIGQPFLLNCPAKVAAFWFFPEHRATATAILVAINLLGLGVGFLVPALVVSEESVGVQAEKEIGRLYLGYFLAAAACFSFNCVFMRSQPSQPPSAGATAEKVSSPKEILRVFQSDRNLWRFYAAYFLVYGTFVAFASNVNFIIKPYGYSDLEIAINAILLLLIGSTGAILFSLMIQKTGNYRTAVRIISLGSTLALVLLCAWLNTLNFKIATALIIGLLGFLLTPVIPTSYELGCELAFPLGEAQITGLLNGGAFLWTFLAGTIVTIIFGFGKQLNSLLIMIALSVFIGIGCFLYFKVEMKLKRTNYEREIGGEKQSELGSPVKIHKDNGQTETQSSRRYSILVDEKTPSAPAL